ncbi:hypothetical protein [Saccharopolyspora phatthalungensis]|uniref:Uncharacterized protein n=1 Tax=Saccharopolyspora phatthalungensis TaxID=664693 RepID=A0A840Q1H8_9PSEU|nr:hypothetical protein [Saccharopolyspora phatthalungensis]MBB5156372.1 hypothetical protein [Saccharopolyspora phatthalungensis]
MTAALVSTGLLVVGVLAVWATLYYAPARHAVGSEGALTVSCLIERVESETGGGRHRLREPRTVQLCGDLADDLAVEETRILPLIEAGLPVAAGTSHRCFHRHVPLLPIINGAGTG